MRAELKLNQSSWRSLTQPTVPEGVETPQAASTTLEDLTKQAQEKNWAAVYSFESNGSKIVVVDRAPIDHPLDRPGIPAVEGDNSRYAFYRVGGDGKLVSDRPRQTVVAGANDGEFYHQFGAKDESVHFRFERKDKNVVLKNFQGAASTLKTEYARP